VDVCRLLESSVSRARRSSIPSVWAQEPAFGSCATLDDVVHGVRGLDERSDELLGALVRRARFDELAASVAVVALLPLALARCTKGRDQVDEVIGELAMVIGDAAGAGVPMAGPGVANRLLDRAWARLRRRDRRNLHWHACDPLGLEWRLADHGADPAEVAACRVDLQRAVRWLSAAGPTYGAATRAWNTAVSLSGSEPPSPAVRRRLKYARRLLRRSPVAALVG
jgi:hypothetical protein